MYTIDETISYIEDVILHKKANLDTLYDSFYLYNKITNDINNYNKLIVKYKRKRDALNLKFDNHIAAQLYFSEKYEKPFVTEYYTICDVDEFYLCYCDEYGNLQSILTNYFR